jgi:ATP/maltotriose-dependent transcriptional regulator MalT
MRAAANLWQEDTDAAGEYAQRCADAARATGDRWILAYGHNLQGHVAVARGDYAEARQHYQASYAIREELDDPEGMGTGLTHLARVAVLESNLEEAEQLYRRSLDLAEGVGDMITTANTLNGLGMMACTAGDFASAGQHFADGLRLMAEARMMRLLLTILASTGDWLLQTGRPAEAIGALVLAETHPASDRETRARARRTLTTVAGMVPPEEYAAIVERSRDADPADMATVLIPMLTSPPAVTRPTPDRTDQGTETIRAASPLVEPLTERELAVLRLIAAGRSNREIAEELFLTVNTVRSYSHQLYGKLGVGSRTQALARARELGLLA